MPWYDSPVVLHRNGRPRSFRAGRNRRECRHRGRHFLDLCRCSWRHFQPANVLTEYNLPMAGRILRPHDQHPTRWSHCWPSGSQRGLALLSRSGSFIAIVVLRSDCPYHQRADSTAGAAAALLIPSGAVLGDVSEHLGCDGDGITEGLAFSTAERLRLVNSYACYCCRRLPHRLVIGSSSEPLRDLKIGFVGFGEAARSISRRVCSRYCFHLSLRYQPHRPGAAARPGNEMLQPGTRAILRYHAVCVTSSSSPPDRLLYLTPHTSYGWNPIRYRPGVKSLSRE